MPPPRHLLSSAVHVTENRGPCKRREWLPAAELAADGNRSRQISHRHGPRDSASAALSCHFGPFTPLTRNHRVRNSQATAVGIRRTGDAYAGANTDKKVLITNPRPPRERRTPRALGRKLDRKIRNPRKTEATP